MKISKLTLMGIVLLVTLACVGAVSACEYGCTPGYWKNHPESWEGIYVNAPRMDLNGDGGLDTPLDMLKYHGGSGDYGAKRIFLRAWVAAYLNYVAFGNEYGYPLDVDEAINVWESNDRKTMINFATMLDGYNNAVCPY